MKITRIARTIVAVLLEPTVGKVVATVEHMAPRVVTSGEGAERDTEIVAFGRVLLSYQEKQFPIVSYQHKGVSIIADDYLGVTVAVGGTRARISTGHAWDPKETTGGRLATIGGLTLRVWTEADEERAMAAWAARKKAEAVAVAN